MLRPPIKSIPTETGHPVQKIRRSSRKCVLQSLVKKVKKINPIEHYISPLCPVNSARPICTTFGR